MDDVALVHAFLDHLGSGAIPEWVALLDPEIVADTPFAPEGTPRRFEGRDAVVRRFGDARERMEALEFLDRVVWRTVDGPIVVTCRSEGVRGDGTPYRNSYCWLFTVSDGRITHWVEYFDPQEVMRARSS